MVALQLVAEGSDLSMGLVDIDAQERVRGCFPALDGFLLPVLKILDLPLDTGTPFDIVLLTGLYLDFHESCRGCAEVAVSLPPGAAQRQTIVPHISSSCLFPHPPQDLRCAEEVEPADLLRVF